jgi:hypothetical protein
VLLRVEEAIVFGDVGGIIWLMKPSSTATAVSNLVREWTPYCPSPESVQSEENASLMIPASNVSRRQMKKATG